MRNLTLICLLCAWLSASAQKLPNKQEASIWAPTNVKIDGNTNEWGGFAAYNTINHLYYTIANDNNNLYLVVQANDEYTSEKAIFGIKLTVNLPGEKGEKSKNNVVITYPTIVEIKKPDPIRNTIETIRKLKNDTSLTTRRKIDSLRQFANKSSDNAFKEIGVGGIKDISDAAISIYNIQDIKVVAKFGPPITYTYELAIPLKYLNAAINNGRKFSFNIKLNGIPEKTSDSPHAPPMIRPDGAAFMDPNISFVMFPTDFSGEYTLAKAP